MPELRTYKRGKTEVVVNGHKHELLDKKIFEEIKRQANFVRLPNSTGQFSQILEKEIFIKKAIDPETDIDQMKDYLKQSQVVDNIPEIYGYIKLNDKLYIIQKLILDSMVLSDYLKKADKKEILRIKEQLRKQGEILLQNNLLPWDFKIKNLIYSKKDNKVYICDNEISHIHPELLYSLIKRANLQPSRKLKLLRDLSKIKRKVVLIKQKLLNLNKKTSNAETVLQSNKEMKSSKLKRLIHSETKKIYSNLSSQEIKKIQQITFEEFLADLDSYLK
ncbi:MAG: hypothetical protein WCX82_01790 [archaeon]|jgi:hypothetical protein